MIFVASAVWKSATRPNSSRWPIGCARLCALAGPMAIEIVAAVNGGGLWRRVAQGRALPVATLLLVIFVLWYAAAIGLNAPQVRDRLNRSGQPWTASDLVAGTWSMERPVLPTPSQIGAELWKTVVATPIASKRS